MASKSNLVNLDAMIKRSDFASTDGDGADYDSVSTISLRDFTPGALMGPSLRKPDFQRETNHWSPEQVVSLLECFVNGDLIPSVILWKSPANVFVIDGGHRLSVLRAWIEDDYGDSTTSQTFFGFEISKSQKLAATRTRALIAERVGTWQDFLDKSTEGTADLSEKKRLNAVVTRGLSIQWVRGDADKAESSFFQINTKGTPLDEVEELLLRSRFKPVAIAARAVIRSGKGHRYWSRFNNSTATKIEAAAKQVHTALFDPELNQPIKTLDLPLAGPKGVRGALQVLIELMLVACRDQLGKPKDVVDMPNDEKGSETIKILTKTLALIRRMTGNEKGSLGLHPAVYFYGPTGRHSSPMFMGTAKLLAKKIINNDKKFFQTFTEVRSSLEDVLIEHKDLMATILQKLISLRRAEKYADLLDKIIEILAKGEKVTDGEIVKLAGLDGKIVTGNADTETVNFSDDSKSKVFIRVALASSVKCPICDGYLDLPKSVSYDHSIRKQDGGKGSSKNLQLTHPYCNQSVKN
jgi:hypothetical protein